MREHDDFSDSSSKITNNKSVFSFSMIISLLTFTYSLFWVFYFMKMVTIKAILIDDELNTFKHLTGIARHVDWPTC